MTAAPRGYTVAMIGDSHANQWLPAMREVAEENCWYLITNFKSSCSFSSAPVKSVSYHEWNEALSAELANEKFDMVVSNISLLDKFSGPDSGKYDRGRERVSRCMDAIRRSWHPRLRPPEPGRAGLVDPPFCVFEDDRTRTVAEDKGPSTGPRHRSSAWMADALPSSGTFCSSTGRQPHDRGVLADACQHSGTRGRCAVARLLQRSGILGSLAVMRAAVGTQMPVNGIDRAKGLLMFLVIYGHTFSMGVDQDVTKWIIYGFHMPAFLYLSDMC